VTASRPYPREPERVTIVDVANDAGVSKATVSRVLNDGIHVREQTRERVLEAVQRLGFRPSRTAQSLATGRTLLIGVVVSDITIPFFTRVARAIQDRATRRGYLVLVGNSDERAASEDDLVRAFEARMVDGLIVVPAVGLHETLVSASRRVPLVLVDRLLDELPADAVLADNTAGAREAVEHLLALGHRRIAYVTDALDKTSTLERLAGYEEAFRRAGVGVSEDLIWVVDYHTDAAERSVVQLLRRHRPTAVVAAEGSITLGVFRATRRLGLHVPRELSIIGFDQLDWSSATDPPLTVVSQDAEGIGTHAVDLLMRRVAQGASADLSPRIRRVPTRLIVRDSCAAPS
jgi:LacI family transcriptional regulator